MPVDLKSFLERRRELTAKPLSGYSHEWHFLPQTMVPSAATTKARSAGEGMVRIPAGIFDFNVRGIEIEGFNWVGLDVQYEWEDSPRRAHSHRMQVPAFDIDKYPVTNAEFKKFLDASHYQADGRS